MSRFVQFAFLWLSAFLLTGCCHLVASSRPFPHQPLPETLAAEIAELQPDKFIERDISWQTNRAFLVRRLELTLPTRPSGSNNVIDLDCFLPRRVKSPWPVVVVTPISGGQYELESHAARYFARNGMAAIVIHRPESDRRMTNGAQINALLKRSVQNDLRTVDWLVTRPEFDAQRIVVFGVSLGAIQGTMFVAADPRLRAAALGLTGGDIADILAHSQEKSYNKRRAALLREQHVTLEELQRQFAAAITCEPLRFAPYVPREKVMLVLAVFDHVVPAKNGRELRNAMGKPETLFILAGHFTAILYLPYIELQAWEFYHERFAAKPTKP